MKKLLTKTLLNLSTRRLGEIQDRMTVAHDDFNGLLLRRALYKTNDKDVSHDLVQTTFLKTLLYLQKGGRIDLMRSFLGHILGDLIIDEYRKKKTLSLDNLLEKGFEPSSDEYQKNINILDGKDIILLIPQLPKKYESVIRLRYLNGLALKEIALITGQSENTVAVQAHRGLAKLKTLYTGIHNVSSYLDKKRVLKNQVITSNL
jgi:RNA polymerase sigma factor (sigma-70 family)